MKKLTECAEKRKWKSASCDMQPTFFDWLERIEQQAREKRLKSIPNIHRLTLRGLTPSTAAAIAALAGPYIGGEQWQ